MKFQPSTDEICAGLRSATTMDTLAARVHKFKLKRLRFAADPQLWSNVRAKELLILRTLLERMAELKASEDPRVNWLNQDDIDG